jgi:S1-C subfamily serine protease
LVKASALICPKIALKSKDRRMRLPTAIAALLLPVFAGSATAPPTAPPSAPSAPSLPSAPSEPILLSPPVLLTPPKETPAWSTTLERVATGVVAIQIDATRAFDTEWSTSAQATGFVVDAKRGLILTNRHVVTPGPVTAQATFLNREEVQLYPVYRDPVHDFGIYRYDPSKLRFIQPAELELYPQGAQVGREIRVVGNDAGEQISILAGTLARLDREAPEYGVGKYNDFNTFYYQAASSTSGGSSGSPVIDIEGRVLALNAGGSSAAASSFYLPLTHVTRALALIKAGKPVTRGTLEVVFKYTPFDELRRLGLRDETEVSVRKAFAHQTGMLVVAETQPGSAAASVLEPGDILVRVNGHLLTEFDPLEATLDDSVGHEVELEIQRGGVISKLKLRVEDLHAITPAEYIEFGDAVVHKLSYQQARHFNVPMRGVFVANPGYSLGSAGVPRGAVLVSVAGRQIDNLDDMQAALDELADGAKATVRFFTIDDVQSMQLRVMHMDRLWFPARRCHRDDTLGIWPCTTLAAGPAPQPPRPASTSFSKSEDPRVAKLQPSLVMINYDMPFSISGVTERNYHGTGLVIDAGRGWVVTDRNTVPVAVGDVRLTFAGTLEVPARVVYVHPLHNLALIAYDPALVGKTPVASARLGTRPMREGDEVWAVGLRADETVASRRTEIAAIDPVHYGLSFQFRDTNLETASLVNPPEDYDGVLADRGGAVVGLWSSFAYQSGRDVDQESKGVSVDLVREMIDVVQSSRPLYSLEAELQLMPLATARKLGLPDERVSQIEANTDGRRQVLVISRLVAGSPAAALLKTGDLLLAIDGKVMTRFREVEKAAQKPRVAVTLWRGTSEMTIDVPTAALSGQDVDRFVIWAGATLQPPYRAIVAQRGIEPRGVMISYFYYGSPASRVPLLPLRRIVEVDGVPTPDLDAFVNAVANRPDRSSVRLKTVNWNEAVEVLTLKLDKHYWPTYELKRTPTGWRRVVLD